MTEMRRIRACNVLGGDEVSAGLNAPYRRVVRVERVKAGCEVQLIFADGLHSHWPPSRKLFVRPGARPAAPAALPQQLDIDGQDRDVEPQREPTQPFEPEPLFEYEPQLAGRRGSSSTNGA
jgi:hypothetical protein